MRKKLISALATKFEGAEAKVLGRIADKLMKDNTIATDEDVNSAVEEVTFADILKSYGDSRAAEASKTAVSNYEKKHGLKDGRPTSTEDDPDGDDDPDSDELEKGDGKQAGSNTGKTSKNNSNTEMLEVMKQLKTMGEALKVATDEIASMKKGKVTEDRKSRINEIIKDLRPSQKKAYNRLQLDGYTDEEFEDFIDEITNEVADLDAENKADGGSFGAPKGGSNQGAGPKGEATDAEVDSIVNSFNL